MKKLFLFLLALLLAGPASAGTTMSFGKSASSAEIEYTSPSTSRCTRIASASSSTAYGQFIRFDTTTLLNGCVVIMTGLAPAEIASSYQMSLRLYYTTASESGKVVGLLVRSYAIIDAAATGAYVERSTLAGTVELTSGAARDFQPNQVGYVSGTITVKKPDGTACTSDCHNRELVLFVQPSSSMTVSTGGFYLVGYQLQFTTP